MTEYSYFCTDLSGEYIPRVFSFDCITTNTVVADKIINNNISKEGMWSGGVLGPYSKIIDIQLG